MTRRLRLQVGRVLLWLVSPALVEEADQLSDPLAPRALERHDDKIIRLLTEIRDELRSSRRLHRGA